MFPPMTLSAVVALMLGAIAAVRVAIHFWLRLFPRSQTSRILRAIATERASRHRDIELLSAYHRHRPDAATNPDALPDRAWQDLDLDEVFASLDYAESEPGRQYLYHLLRAPTRGRPQLAKLERAVARFSADDSLAATARKTLGRLSDRRSARLVHLLFGELPNRPRGWLIFPLLTATSLSCLALIGVWPRSLLVWVGICVVNVAVQVFYKPSVKEFIPAIHELPAFLAVGDALGAITADELSDETKRLRDSARPIVDAERHRAARVHALSRRRRRRRTERP